MEAAEEGVGLPGDQASWWRHAPADQGGADGPGAGDHRKGARPDDPGGRRGVPPAERSVGERVHHGPGDPRPRADAKKKTLKATEQAEPRIQELRRRFIEYAKTLDPRRLVFVDEAGSNIGMTREYARAPRGERVHGSVPRNRGEVTTMIGALDVHGMRALMTIEGGTDTDVFEAFLENVLARRLRPGDIVVLDNVGAHKPEHLRRLVEATGARLVFLPPYSPDFNPIELAWSKLKAALKDFGARTREDLDTAIKRAMDLICADDAAGWFTHCGYQAQVA